MMENEIGRVITRFGAELILESTVGEHIRCTTRRKLEHVACGDQVVWQKEEHGNATVLDILPRKNILERPDFRGKPRPVAANIDVLLVVTSWRPAPSWEMLDRYLVAARLLPADVIIIINKADLRPELSNPEAEATLEEYTKVGYPILHTQAKHGQGMEAIYSAFAGRTAILVGQSGVGKSSLIRQLLPEYDHIRVGEIAETGEGKHTTTATHLYRLPGGGALIDSPGVRDFALARLDVSELQAGYPEFDAYAGECRFHDCSHQHEPGCAIKAAVNSGDLPARRYQRYLTLLKNQNNSL